MRYGSGTSIQNASEMKKCSRTTIENQFHLYLDEKIASDLDDLMYKVIREVEPMEFYWVSCPVLRLVIDEFTNNGNYNNSQ